MNYRYHIIFPSVQSYFHLGSTINKKGSNPLFLAFREMEVTGERKFRYLPEEQADVPRSLRLQPLIKQGCLATNRRPHDYGHLL